MFRKGKSGFVLLTIYGVIAITLSSLSLYFAFQTIGKPFAGFLPFQNLYVGAFTQSSWEGGKQNLKYHDRVQSIDGKIVRDGNEFHQHLEGKSEIELGILSGIEEKLSQFSVETLLPNDVFVIFAPLFGTGLAFLVIGLLALMVHPAPAGVVSFATFCLCLGAYFLSAYDFHTTYHLVPVLLFSFALVPAVTIDLIVSFPKKMGHFPKLRGVAYGFSGLMAIPYIWLFSKDSSRWVWFEYAFFLYLSMAYLFWLVVMAHRSLRDQDDTVRRQCRILLIPMILAFGFSFIVTWMVFVFDWAIPLNWVAPFSLVFPLAIGYAMLRQNLFLVDHLEQQIHERTNVLKKTQAELFEASKLASVGTLAAGMAHEIGNAMHLISSNLPILRKYTNSLINSGRESAQELEFVKEDMPELLSNMERGAQRAQDITMDLKNFSKPEKASFQRVSLQHVLEGTLRLLKIEFGSNISVVTKFSSIPEVMGSERQLHQIFLNLLLNAKQAIEGKGEIRVSIYGSDAEVVVEIQDDGRGISPEHQARILEPFFTTKERGTGLGLSVTKGLVEAYGGKLAIESEIGKGTNVKVFFPTDIKNVA